MSEEPDDCTIEVNVDSTRDDIKDLLSQLNPLLQQVLDIVQNYPDQTAQGETGAKFSKILFSRIPGGG